MGFPGDSVVKNLPVKKETGVPSPGWEEPLEKKMAIHSSILAWEILWTKEHGSPWGHKRVRHNSVTKQQLYLSIYLPIYLYLSIYVSIYLYIYIYIYPLFLGFTSYLGHHRTLSRVPCAIKKVIIYLFMCACMLRHFSSVWLWIVAHQAPCLWDSPSNIYFVLSINSVGLLSLVAQTVKNPPAMRETWLWSLGWNVPCRRAWQPTVVVPIYILICRSIPFSAHPLQDLFVDFLNDRQSNWCEVLPACSFDLHLSNS